MANERSVIFPDYISYFEDKNNNELEDSYLDSDVTANPLPKCLWVRDVLEEEEVVVVSPTIVGEINEKCLSLWALWISNYFYY